MLVFKIISNFANQFGFLQSFVALLEVIIHSFLDFVFDKFGCETERIRWEISETACQ